MLNSEFLSRKTVPAPMVSPRMRIQNSELSHWSDSPQPLSIHPTPNAQFRIPIPKNRTCTDGVPSDENSEFGIESLVRFPSAPQHPTNTNAQSRIFTQPHSATVYSHRRHSPRSFLQRVPMHSNHPR